MSSLHFSDEVLRVYTTSISRERDVFLKDSSQLQGRFYAVKTDANTIEIKSIFSSVHSLFSFLKSVIFDTKNTFLSVKSINNEINTLTITKTTAVTTPILTTTKPSEPETATPQIDPIAALKEKYYAVADEIFPFLDNWFTTIKSHVANKEYALNELAAMEELMARKEAEVSQILTSLNKDTSNTNTLDTYFKDLKNQIADLRKSLEEPSTVRPPSPPVPGIKNAGNSCYLNSALQGLLGSACIRDRIHAYTKDTPPYIKPLKEFLAAYDSYAIEPTAKTASAIGKHAAELRRQIFEERLEALGVEQLYAMADADLILMVLAESLGLEYSFVTRKSAIGGIDSTGAFITAQITSDVVSKQLLWPEMNTSGTGKQPSIQETFNQQCKEATVDSDLGWRAETANGSELTVNDATSCYRIRGAPPELIAMKVGASKGEFMDTQFTPYSTTARDEFLDIAQAFDTPQENTKYRLVGILENHGRAHWTAMSRRADGWHNCNDAHVRLIGQDIPQSNAAIMIYERIH
ncbi:MAG: ubiquitin carboxyl-terminal hydrolase [Chlamydiales bacterium]|nr:ubiquitin carboxyl-terminal hydrolase [Chlamydiales bacterium]